MAAPTPLIPQYAVADVPPTLPTGVPGYNATATPPWLQAYNPVHLTLSSGETVYIGTVLALCQLATTMLRQGQHLISPSEEVFIDLAARGDDLSEPEASNQRVFHVRPRSSRGLGPQRELHPFSR